MLSVWCGVWCVVLLCVVCCLLLCGVCCGVLFVVIVVVVVVVRTDDLTQVFVDTRQQVHLIGVTEHLGVRLPASPLLGLNVQMDGGRKMLQNCSKLLIAATMPAKQGPHALLQLCVPVSVAKRNVHKLWRGTESEALDCRNPSSLQDHRDVHNHERNWNCGTSTELSRV